LLIEPAMSLAVGPLVSSKVHQALMPGGGGRQQFNTVTVWVHVALWLQQSVACHAPVQIVWHWSITMLLLLVKEYVRLLQHASLAVGWSKLQPLAEATVLLGAQVITGANVSTTVTVCVQVAVLLQQSLACQTP